MELNHGDSVCVFFLSFLLEPRYSFVCMRVYVVHWLCLMRVYVLILCIYVAETHHITQLINFDKGWFTSSLFYSENHFHSMPLHLNERERKIHAKRFDFGPADLCNIIFMFIIQYRVSLVIAMCWNSSYSPARLTQSHWMISLASFMKNVRHSSLNDL